MTTTVESPALPVSDGTGPATLSALLRVGTREEHTEAETMGYIETLMSGGYGERGRAAYTSLAVQQHAIYRALEEAGARIAATSEGAAAGIVLPVLTRTPQIEADLADLVGGDWPSQITYLPATQRYVERLLASASSLATYAAHAYTRYLGDLSGGQVIKVMLQRHYGLGDEGLRFYTFEEIAKPKVFKDEYRALLDALPLDDAGRATAVAEAQEAFRLNRALFAELGQLHPAA